MIGLAVAGMVVLRRQVEAEFPGAAPAGDLGLSLRTGAARAVHAVRSAGSRAPEAVVRPAPRRSRVEELERLAELHDRGALSDAEYATEKAMLNQKEVVG
ncbi:MAG: SHOCT domain-containing protein [Solirubrobacterales bacterium]|nr:SHOCT domain-containing protein [Solirubrobacterales bacterium]